MCVTLYDGCAMAVELESSWMARVGSYRLSLLTSVCRACWDVVGVGCGARLWCD